MTALSWAPPAGYAAYKAITVPASLWATGSYTSPGYM